MRLRRRGVFLGADTGRVSDSCDAMELGCRAAVPRLHDAKLCAITQSMEVVRRPLTMASDFAFPPAQTRLDELTRD